MIEQQRPLLHNDVGRREPDVRPDGPGYRAAKRATDVVVAALMLLAALPLMLVVAALIRAGGPGPILFRQVRLGRRGARFRMYKFRTMVTDAEWLLATRPDLRRAFEENFKIQDDPRVTPFGRWLRRTSLDELPQLFNVLGGSMTLIGPRPIVPDELGKYGEYGPKLLAVKPGLGGNWQAHGRSSTTYAERVALDMAYIDRRSWRLDLRLLGQTALSVCRRQGSC